MILANFDLSFFTSIPGMLITGGVLLLLIALIIFVATGSKKGKKDKKEAESTDNTNTTVATTPTVDMNVATEPVASAVTPTNEAPTVENAPQIVVTTPEVQSEPVSVVENGTPVVNKQNIQNSNETIEPNTIPNEVVSPQVEMPAQTIEPNTTNANDNISVNTNPVVMPSEVNTVEQASVPNNTVAPSNQDDNEVVNTPPITIVNEEPKEDTVIEPPKPIYGGIDPVIPKIEVEGNEHRPIYGGANPLENTGAIPTINNNTVENSTIPTTPEVPNVEQNVETPKVEPEVVNVPTVDNAPANNVEPITPVQEEQAVVEEQKQEPKNQVEVESLF